MAFEGFDKSFLAFFSDLAANNNREWFLANKNRYDEKCLEPFRDLLAAVNDEFAERNVPVVADTKRSIFRIHRDIRFSKDKSPYKTHIAATFGRDPGEMSRGMIYVHLGADEMFVGAGFYEFADAADLARFRDAIIRHENKWKTIETDLTKAGFALSRDNSLKRPPKGFEDAPEELIDTLKLKSFVARLHFKPQDLKSPELITRIGSFGVATAPLLRFGWVAL